MNESSPGPRFKKKAHPDRPQAFEYVTAYSDTDRDRLAEVGWQVHTMIPVYYAPGGIKHPAGYLMERIVSR